VQERKTKSAFY